MKISKTHKNFARRLKNQEVLTHPEKYLGPNWEAVINFWLYLDTLNKKQLKVVNKRYWDLSQEERDISWDKVFKVIRVTTNYAFHARSSACGSVFCASSAAANATDELIGLEKLLDQGYQLQSFPLFLQV
jgi:hypothetical protein